MLKPGWYWVRHKSQRWMAVEYHASRLWRTSSTIMNYYDDDFLEIGPRIPTPDEPWQCVPVEPTAAMVRALWQAEPLDRYAAMLAAAPKPETQP